MKSNSKRSLEIVILGIALITLIGVNYHRIEGNLRITTPKEIVPPKTAYDYYQLGKKLKAERKFIEAEEAQLKAIAINDETISDKLGRVYLELGSIYHQIYIIDLALEHTLKALELVKGKERGNEERAIYNLGVIYWAKEDLKASWEYFNKALQMKSSLGKDFWRDDPEYEVYYVMHNDRKGFFKHHKDGVRKIKEGNLPSVIFEWQEHLKKLIEDGQDDKVIEEGEFFLERQPKGKFNYVASKFLVTAYLRKKQYEDSFKHLQLLDKAPLDIESRAWQQFSYAFYYEGNQKYDKALKYLNRVINKYRDYKEMEEVYLIKVRVLASKGDVESQRKTLKQIVKRFPNSELEKYANYKISFLELIHRQNVEKERLLAFHFVCEKTQTACPDSFEMTSLFQEKLCLQNSPVFTISDIAFAEINFEEVDPLFYPDVYRKMSEETDSKPIFYQLIIVFSEEVKSKLLKVTENNLGKRLGIIVDGSLVMAPKILEPIKGGVVQVLGDLRPDDLKVIADKINIAKENFSK